MTVTFKVSKQGIAYWLACVLWMGLGSVGIHYYQWIHGFNNPLFLYLGAITFVIGALVYWQLLHEKLGSVRISWVVFVLALFISIIAVLPSVNSLVFPYPNDYLSVRARLFFCVAFPGVYFFMVFAMSLVRVTKGYKG